MATAIKNRSNLPQRTATKTNKASRRERGCFAPKKIDRYAFLNESFKDIPVVDLPGGGIPFGQILQDNSHVWKLDQDIEIDAEANLEYLAKGTHAYCLLHGGTFEFHPTGNPLHDLWALFQMILSCKPANREVAIDYDFNATRFVFVEYEMCEFDYNTLFFLPVKFYEKLPEKLKPLVADSLGYFISCCNLSLPTAHMDMSFALGEWSEEEVLDALNEYADDEYVQLYREMMDSYKNGSIATTIDAISHFPADPKAMYCRLESAIAEYDGKPLGNLLKTIKDGILLNQHDHISNYFETPSSCTLSDYADNENLMDFERLFAVVYDFADPITERAMECINNEAGSLEIQGLYDKQIIDINVKKDLRVSEFPKKWCTWFSNLCAAIEEI